MYIHVRKKQGVYIKDEACPNYHQLDQMGIEVKKEKSEQNDIIDHSAKECFFEAYISVVHPVVGNIVKMLGVPCHQVQGVREECDGRCDRQGGHIHAHTYNIATQYKWSHVTTETHTIYPKQLQ